jgi:hypothetical protein
MFALALIVVGTLYAINKEYLYERPTNALSSIMSCGMALSDSYGECMPAGCGARAGWRAQSTMGCKGGNVCCILEEPERYFTPGTLILAYDGKQLKLYNVQPATVDISLKKSFAIYFVPNATKLSATDDICALAAVINNSEGKSAPMDFSAFKVPNCYNQAAGQFHAVMLYEGTGDSFKKLIPKSPDLGSGPYGLVLTADQGGVKSTARLYIRLVR